MHMYRKRECERVKLRELTGGCVVLTRKGMEVWILVPEASIEQNLHHGKDKRIPVVS